MMRGRDLRTGAIALVRRRTTSVIGLEAEPRNPRGSRSPSMSQQTLDLDCWERLRSGDARALRELYDRYGTLLYSVAHRILGNASDAEDAVQRCWVQVWETAASYDPRRGPVAAWLLTVARSRSLDLVRSLASRRRAEDAVEAQPQDSSPEPSDTAEQRILRERIRRALQTLSAEQRQVL